MATLGDQNAADVFRIGHQTQATHQVLFTMEVDVLAANLPVVGGNGRHHLLVAKAVFDEAARIDEHLELLLIAAPRENVIHTRRGAQDHAHPPILGTAQIHARELVVQSFQGVPEHLAQA